ncbi:TonB-dependent receptor plug domain-containing protein [Niveispirillum sp. KHB5.9]|uniref:TonB-dependent receptor plug domain-containing protein n=1 Tax=Niveispirillum sp. KHB5.9 TaxID=3400269 RepID=UPI003A8A905B
MRIKRTQKFVSTSLSALAVAMSVAAHAADDQPTDLEEIIVTGSRVSTTFNSPTPVNVIDDERLKMLAIPDVSTALNQLPAFRATTSQSTILFRVTGAIGANTPDLRGLGATRTLVLVDGRRFVPSLDNGAVDLNGIPSSMVKRTDIVTGGASAQYGADAVAGVVNLILDTKLSGFKFDANAGISGHGDAKNTSVSAAGGTDFANGRGHVVAGIEYRQDWGVGNCFKRDWCAKLTNYVPNPGYINGVSTNGLPATLVLDNVNFVYTPNGVLTSAIKTVNGVRTVLGQQVNHTGATALPASLRGLQFNNGGTALIPFQFGNYLSGTFMQGGDQAASNNWGWGNVPLVTPTSHVSMMTHGDYELTDNVTAFGEFIYSRVEGGPVRTTWVNAAPVGGTNGISINNPYITPEVRAQILAADPNITAINVNSILVQTGDTALGSSTNNTYRFVGGLKGELAEDWQWDVAYEYGLTDSNLFVGNTRLSMLDNQAANAITPPASYAGTIYRTSTGAPVICASSVANPNDGCVPVNFLGTSLTPAQLEKYMQDEWQTRRIVQHNVSANLRHTLFELPAGPVKAAIGFEYRYDSASGKADPLTLAGLFTAPQVTALPKVIHKVTEGYAAVNIPILSDLPLAKSLTVDLTGRQTHYSTFGNAHPWKIGVEYQPDDQIMFRATRSADIRKPTAAESNPNTVSTNLPLNDPFGGGNHLIANLTGGNPALKLESGKTTTLGVVLKPDFIPNFRVSVDYYDIKVNNAIDTVTGANILTACATQDLLCNLITFSGAYKASPAVSILSTYQNVAKVLASGYEITSDYTIEDVYGGNVGVQVNANYITKLRSIGGTGLVTRMNGVTGNAGSTAAIAGVPTYKIDAVISYVQPKWAVSTHLRYIPQSILDPNKIGPTQAGYDINNPRSANINTVSSVFYVDLSGSFRPYQFSDGLESEIYWAVNNVGDVAPPPELRLFGNPLQYDPIGRAFRLGVRAKW